MMKSMNFDINTFDNNAFASVRWSTFKSSGRTKASCSEAPPSKRQKTQSSWKSNLFITSLQSQALSGNIMKPSQGATSGVSGQCNTANTQCIAPNNTQCKAEFNMQSASMKSMKSYKISISERRERVKNKMPTAVSLRAPRLRAINAPKNPSPLAMSQRRPSSDIDSLHSSTKTLSDATQSTDQFMDYENGLNGSEVVEFKESSKASKCTLLDIMKGMDTLTL